MPQLYEMSLGLLHPVGGPAGISGCRCLLIETDSGVVLIDTGFGTAELQSPERFFGPEAKTKWRIVADPGLSALSQIEHLGLARRDVRHIVCTHLDMDHVGGLVDFPEAAVHVSSREYDSFASGHPRYLKHQFQHGPRWALYGGSTTASVAGLDGWAMSLGQEIAIAMVPLYGHTAGHCGVVIQSDAGTILHAGDSYYRRGELGEGHPADSSFPVVTADDNPGRLKTLTALSKVVCRDPSIQIVSTHDLAEQTALNSPQQIAARP